MNQWKNVQTVWRQEQDVDGIANTGKLRGCGKWRRKQQFKKSLTETEINNADDYDIKN